MGSLFHCVGCSFNLVGIVGVVLCWLDPPADMSAADMLTCHENDCWHVSAM